MYVQLACLRGELALRSHDVSTVQSYASVCIRLAVRHASCACRISMFTIVVALFLQPLCAHARYLRAIVEFRTGRVMAAFVDVDAVRDNRG